MQIKQKKTIKRIETKKDETKGIAKYLCDDSDSDSESNDDELFENADEDDMRAMKVLSQSDDPVTLIDFELVNILKFCQEMYESYKNNNEDY